MDLFSIKQDSYIVAVDYYSDYWEVKQLDKTTAEHVIQFCKEQFSRHGIPQTIVTDNGPQFTNREFAKFTKDWELVHVTSSPTHSQSNGKAESAVKIVKSILKKSQRDGNDKWLAILDWRNAPSEGQSSSPV